MGPVVLMDFAMATNFGTQFAVTGFVGYNFGCIASDTLFDSRGWFFGVKPSGEDIAEIDCLRVVAMATNFWHSWATTEPCMCGGDAALCQISLTTCFYFLLNIFLLVHAFIAK